MRLSATRRHLCAALACAALLAACAPLTPKAPPDGPAASQPTAPQTLPDAYYRQLRAAGQPVLRIDAPRSLIAVTVRRGGTLARLGHDHVVASRTLEGYVAPQAGRSDFRFRLDQMSVDEEALRERAGLHSQPGADAIDGTRRNMLTKVLDAERHPYVLVRAERGPSPGTLLADITLHGVTRRYTIPAVVSADARGASASGELTLRQSDFGIVPFSVLGGALAVEDQLELRFEIAAAP